MSDDDVGQPLPQVLLDGKLLDTQLAEDSRQLLDPCASANYADRRRALATNRMPCGAYGVYVFGDFIRADLCSGLVGTQWHLFLRVRQWLDVRFHRFTR